MLAAHIEELVVLQVVDGIADTTILHLPAATLHESGWGTQLDGYDFPPAKWPSACRNVKSGSIYVRAGMLAEAAVCGDCEALCQSVRSRVAA